MQPCFSQKRLLDLLELLDGLTQQLLAIAYSDGKQRIARI